MVSAPSIRGTTGIACAKGIIKITTMTATKMSLASRAGLLTRRTLTPLLALIHRSAWKGYSPKFALTEFHEVRAGQPYRGPRLDRPSGWEAATTREPMMRQNDEESTRLPPGYTLDLIGDPCVIVLSRADGTMVARFTNSVDPEEIKRAAEEDRSRVELEPDG